MPIQTQRPSLEYEMDRQDAIHPDGYPPTRDGVRLAIATAQDELNEALGAYRRTVDFTNAAEVLAARVHLGTATWGEWFRYYLRLGPSKKALEAAEMSRQFRETIARWRSHEERAD